MGITIDVESIIRPPSKRIGGGPPRYAEGDWEYIKAICQAFDWKNVPWEEPSERTGTIETSANYSRYSRLQEVALGEYGELEAIKDGFGRFPHLLDHDEYWTIYIPVDFLLPVHFEMSENLKTSFPSNTFTIGSSVKVIQELHEIDRVLKIKNAQHGENTYVRSDEEPGQARHTWGGVYDLCLTFLQAARESVELNLPFHIRW